MNKIQQINGELISTATDLAFGNDIYMIFQPGQKESEEMLLGMVQYLITEHGIFDQDGEHMIPTIENLADFGILVEEIIPSRNSKRKKMWYKVIKTFIILHSSEWYQHNKKE